MHEEIGVKTAILEYLNSNSEKKISTLFSLLYNEYEFGLFEIQNSLDELERDDFIIIDDRKVKINDSRTPSKEEGLRELFSNKAAIVD